MTISWMSSWDVRCVQRSVELKSRMGVLLFSVRISANPGAMQEHSGNQIAIRGGGSGLGEAIQLQDPAAVQESKVY